MKEIPLSQGLFALVDDEDYDELIKYKWIAHKQKQFIYVVRSNCVNYNNELIYMHRQIMKDCGGKGFYLVKEDTNLGYDSLNLKLCNCVLGTNLRDKWAREKEERNKKGE